MSDLRTESANVSGNGQNGVLALSGEFSDSDVIQVRKRLEAEIEVCTDKALVVDLSALRTFNSEVLSLCLCLIRKAQSSGGELRFDNTPRKLFDMARVGGIEFIFSA